MRTKWLPEDKIGIILAALRTENELACEMSLRYGMRIGDVLRTKTKDVEKGRWTYKEEKTGKTRRITLSNELRLRLLRIAGRVYCFEGRSDWRKHRTRQAVYKDIRRVSNAFGLGNGIGCHTMRKEYAVERYRAYGGNLKRVQRLLNHSNEAVTMIYALADRLNF